MAMASCCATCSSKSRSCGEKPVSSLLPKLRVPTTPVAVTKGMQYKDWIPAPRMRLAKGESRFVRSCRRKSVFYRVEKAEAVIECLMGTVSSSAITSGMVLANA